MAMKWVHEVINQVIVAGTLAPVLPARRASRLNVLRELQYE